MSDPQRLRESATWSALLEEAENYPVPESRRKRLLGALSNGGLAGLTGLSVSNTGATGASPTDAGAPAANGSTTGGSGAGTGAQSAIAAGSASGSAGSALPLLLKTTAVFLALGVGGVALQKLDERRSEAAEARPAENAPLPEQTLRRSQPSESPDDRPADLVRPERTATDDAERAPGGDFGDATRTGRAEWVPLPQPQAPSPTGAQPSDAASAPFDELEGLSRARRLVRSGQATVALQVLAEHRQWYPNSPLSLEREVLTIEAMSATSQHRAARSLARAFVERHPHHLLSERLRKLAGTDSAPVQPEAPLPSIEQGGDSSE